MIDKDVLALLRATSYFDRVANPDGSEHIELKSKPDREKIDAIIKGKKKK
jgi:hypothetical protein